MDSTKKYITIKCSSFELRRWLQRDIKSLVLNANNRNVSKNLLNIFPSPYTITDAKKWIELTRTMPPNSNFVIDINGQAAGGIGFHFFNDVHIHSAELGYWLGEKYWGCGVVTEAVGVVCNFIFDNYDINRIFARVFEWNSGSIRVLEKNNFMLEGRLRKQVFKDGVFADELVYGLLKEERAL